MDGLERKLWFVGLVGVLSTLATLYLMESAGLPPLADMNISQLLLYALCYGACWKLVSFGGWLLALCLRKPATSR